jgi:hypothetical protein
MSEANRQDSIPSRSAEYRNRQSADPNANPRQSSASFLYRRVFGRLQLIGKEGKHVREIVDSLV